MAIARVRVDDVHAVVYTKDPDVYVAADVAPDWVPAESAKYGDGADVVKVRPMSGPDFRRGVRNGEWDEWRAVSCGVLEVNGKRGDDALKEVRAFPPEPYSALVNYIWAITQPVAAEVAAEVDGPQPGTKSAEDDG